MKVGIDFGTTRIVVASADRGNYPLVNFEGPDGRFRDWFPSVMAVSGSARVYGWEAFGLQGEEGWTVIRSMKRLLKSAGPQSEIEVAGQRLGLAQLITEMMAALLRDLRQRSTLDARSHDRFEAVLGVPANANSNQRFLTEEAARGAGFEVLGLLNEPSAAAIEFAYRNAGERKNRARQTLLVYDFGGGTFDAALVDLHDNEHTVVASDGIPDLGGDDFDEILALLALKTAGKPGDHEASLSPAEWYLLFDECREKKESLNSNSRKISVDLERVRKGWKDVSIGVDLFYERCRPLIEQSRLVTENLLNAHDQLNVDTLYLTGGGSELPPVARVLRETFGRRVRRSAYMRSATAIGLAIRASGHEVRPIRDQFTKNFGVWREADEGKSIVFDVIFPRGIKLPSKGEAPLRVVRRYTPAHNIGHFRYLECGRLGANDQPEGEINHWDDIRVPFDPNLQELSNLDEKPISRYAPKSGQSVEEEYTCDANGALQVRIRDNCTQRVNEYRLGRWTKNRRRGRG